jgi:hypothetical protein
MEKKLTIDSECSCSRAEQQNWGKIGYSTMIPIGRNRWDTEAKYEEHNLKHKKYHLIYYISPHFVQRMPNLTWNEILTIYFNWVFMFNNDYFLYFLRDKHYESSKSIWQENVNEVINQYYKYSPC